MRKDDENPIDALRRASGERVRQAREAMGMTQAELAEKADTKQQTVDRIERGITLKSKAYPMILKVLGLQTGSGVATEMVDRSVADMIEGVEGYHSDKGFAAFMNEARAITKINEGETIPVFSRTGGGMRLVDAIPRIYPVMLVKDAYALMVSDRDMEPAVRKGDIVVVNPHLPVQIGSEVVVTKRDGFGLDISVKTLLSEDENFWNLKTWMPNDTETIEKNEYLKLEMIVSKISRYR